MAVALLSFSNFMLSFSGAHSNLKPYREGDSANVVAAPSKLTRNKSHHKSLHEILTRLSTGDAFVESW